MDEFLGPAGITQEQGEEQLEIFASTGLFDFFNISGSLFVETQSDAKIRASAQGLFMVMTNGVGAVLGSSISGIVIDRFFTHADGSKDWHGIWIAFALYALATAVLFVPLFKHKHDPAMLRDLHPEVKVGA